MTGEDSVKDAPSRPSVWQVARALLVLARGRRRLRHVPSVAQVAALARCEGWEPCSYLLDKTANVVPAAAERAVAAQRGRYGLCFTCVRPGDGPLCEFGLCGFWLCELVVLDCGRAFDLLRRGDRQLERV